MALNNFIPEHKGSIEPTHRFYMGTYQGMDYVLDKGSRVQIIANKQYIRIGCTDVDIKVLEFLIKKHKEIFSEIEFKTLQ